MTIESFSFLCKEEFKDRKHIIRRLELDSGEVEFRTSDDILCKRLDYNNFLILTQPAIKVYVFIPKQKSS